MTGEWKDRIGEGGKIAPFVHPHKTSYKDYKIIVLYRAI